MTDLLSGIDDHATFDTALEMPYTLTTGAAAGAFMAEMANHVILGSSCPSCQRVTVPPREHCPSCAAETSTYVRMPETGTVTAVTRTAAGGVALIRLDGADCDLVHRVSHDPIPSVGDRVKVRWAEEATTTIDSIALFEPVADGDAAPGTVGDAVTVTQPYEEHAYSLSLEYHHAYGPYYARLFDELASRRRILGSKCPGCSNVLVPPREICDICFVRTAQLVDVPDTGRLQAFSVIHMEFVGQTRKPPYVYAEIVLDGSATRLIHTVGGFDVDTAQETLRVGMPVRAVWKEDHEPRGTLDDIDFFEPISESESASTFEGSVR